MRRGLQLGCGNRNITSPKRVKMSVLFSNGFGIQGALTQRGY
jgi:hypothetical protein